MADKVTILDFLAIPASNTSSVYAKLAEETTAEYLRNNTDPSAYIAKLARENGLNDEGIRRVVELTNQLINRELADKSEDQLFTFPVARPESVYENLEEGSAAEDGFLGTRQEKVASYEEDRLDPSLVRMAKFATEAPLYHEIAEKLKFERYYQAFAAEADMMKLAYEQEHSEANEELPEAVKERIQLHLLKKAEAEYDAAKWSLRERLYELRDALGHLGEEDRLAFAKAAALRYGEDGLTIATVVLGDESYADVAAGELLSSGYPKEAYEVDSHDRLILLLDKVAQDLQTLAEKRQQLEKVAGIFSKILRKPTLLGSAKKFFKNVGKAGDAIGKGVRRSRARAAELGGFRRTLAGKMAFPALLGAGIHFATTGSPLGAVGAGIRSGVSSLVPQSAVSFGEEFKRMA